jgi:mono/diheme cytochrome c family protein
MKRERRHASSVMPTRCAGTGHESRVAYHHLLPLMRHWLRTAFCLLPSVLLVGCEWFTDFRRQPKVDPWESVADSIPPRANPQFSVPMHGTSAPGFAFGRGATIADVNAMSSIANPVAADERSLRSGAQQYQINCAVCHGARGEGDGPVTRFGFPPIRIGSGSNAATTLSDGYIFGIIRNGRGLMPPYNRLEEGERWDLINYLRTLQRAAAGAPAAPSAIGRPGETGALVPGPSATAPTRPAPFFRPTSAVPSATPVPATPNTSRP